MVINCKIHAVVVAFALVLLASPVAIGFDGPDDVEGLPDQIPHSTGSGDGKFRPGCLLYIGIGVLVIYFNQWRDNQNDKRSKAKLEREAPMRKFISDRTKELLEELGAECNCARSPGSDHNKDCDVAVGKGLARDQATADWEALQIIFESECGYFIEQMTGVKCRGKTLTHK